MDITPYHARYFAHDLTRRSADGMDRLSMALFDAAVDLNPHQIEAALFALRSPLSAGVLLADEVGLGKTIEAGIVLCQLWAERKRRLLVIAPASLRKQWALELTEKFHLPAEVLDAKAVREARRAGRDPLGPGRVLVLSFHFAHRLREELHGRTLDLVVIDEAHKLRNAHRPGNRIGQGIRWATQDCRKLLLTATPLQNSLLELYGLASLIDERLFGDPQSFRAQYMGSTANLDALRGRLSSFCKRTLRKEVLEYVRYTERLALTRPFRPTDDEQALYEAVSDFLQRDDSYALPRRQRHLTALVLRKLLASSSQAIAQTLDVLRLRLEALEAERIADDPELLEGIVEGEDLAGDLLDELPSPDDADSNGPSPPSPQPIVDRIKLRAEIELLSQLADRARSIGVDTKSRTLLQALGVAFEQLESMGAARKALIFTESRRTQDYLASFLESQGFAGQVVRLNGTNSGPEASAIYEQWAQANRGSDRVSGSRAVDVRTALIEHFRDHAKILVATEAAAEGVNLQFCSLVVNYDLPWNPQRIEQRIGRCHRYGQRHDVVVVNFLNERNEADARVLQLLEEKFSLFSGVFGASDEVLGSIESGVDFEQRILAIYQQCRTSAEIDAAFQALRAELDQEIRSRLNETHRLLLEHFDQDVHERLRLQLADARACLDRVGRRFWSLTRHQLAGRARFHEEALAFDLDEPPRPEIAPGRYYLISKERPSAGDGTREAVTGFLYRLSHPLGEHVIETAKTLETPFAALIFDVSGHPTRLTPVEVLRGTSGYLSLTRLRVDSLEREEYLLFTGLDADGAPLDQETMEKLFLCSARLEAAPPPPKTVAERLAAQSERHVQGTLSRSLEAGSRHFREAREQLERWADDLILSAEKALEATKEQIKVLRRESRQALTLEDQHGSQTRIQALERQQRRQRQEIFDVEDQILARRDALVAQLEARLAQRTEAETLFTIRWAVA